MTVNFIPVHTVVRLSGATSEVPCDAARSLVRTFIALALSHRGFKEEEAQSQLRIAIAWGRYGGLFDFDATTGQFTRTVQMEASAPS